MGYPRSGTGGLPPSGVLEQVVDHVGGGVGPGTLRDEPGDIHQAVASRDQGGFDVPITPGLSEADRREQAVAQALASFGLARRTTLADVVVDGLCRAAVADLAVGTTVGLAQVAQVAASGTLRRRPWPQPVPRVP